MLAEGGSVPQGGKESSTAPLLIGAPAIRIRAKASQFNHLKISSRRETDDPVRFVVLRTTPSISVGRTTSSPLAPSMIFLIGPPVIRISPKPLPSAPITFLIGAKCGGLRSSFSSPMKTHRQLRRVTTAPSEFSPTVHRAMMNSHEWSA